MNHAFSVTMICAIVLGASVAEANTPPTISFIFSQRTAVSTPITVNFTVGDAESDPAVLTMTGESFNTTVVPNTSLVFGGSGANRSVTITPVMHTFGQVFIELTVHDEGGLTANRVFSLTVASGALLTAAFNPTFAVPACMQLGGQCDTGPFLLNGRDTIAMGNEPNAPNTIFGSCPDGTAGTYHMNESVDALKVTSQNGGVLTPGGLAIVEARMWAIAGDTIDLYGAPNATSPTWSLMNSFFLSGGGLSIQFQTTLPIGTFPALRAILRNNAEVPASAACPGGTLTDVDDLIYHANAAHGDVNADGSSDLMWRNKATGQNIQWQMNGTTIAVAAFLSTIADTNWQIVADEDLDGDGKADLFWRNKATGDNIVWLMDGASRRSAVFTTPNPDLRWEVKAYGDFNGDGKGDLFWRNNVTGENVVWLMNGAVMLSGAFLPTIADTNWEVKGAGDFDGDGRFDIVWRDKVTGQNIVWLMNGTSVASAASLPTIADLNWDLKGVGDVDGDGKADIVWRNGATGHNIVWLMNGTTVGAASFVATITDLNWDIKSMADVDADGRIDVIWRNASTGQNIVWLMNGFTISGAVFLPTIADTNWEFAGPK